MTKQQPLQINDGSSLHEALRHLNGTVASSEWRIHGERHEQEEDYTLASRESPTIPTPATRATAHSVDERGAVSNKAEIRKNSRSRRSISGTPPAQTSRRNVAHATASVRSPIAAGGRPRSKDR